MKWHNIKCLCKTLSYMIIKWKNRLNVGHNNNGVILTSETRHCQAPSYAACERSEAELSRCIVIDLVQMRWSKKYLNVCQYLILTTLLYYLFSIFNFRHNPLFAYLVNRKDHKTGKNNVLNVKKLMCVTMTIWLSLVTCQVCKPQCLLGGGPQHRTLSNHTQSIKI